MGVTGGSSGCGAEGAGEPGTADDANCGLGIGGLNGLSGFGGAGPRIGEGMEGSGRARLSVAIGAAYPGRGAAMGCKGGWYGGNEADGSLNGLFWRGASNFTAFEDGVDGLGFDEGFALVAAANAACLDCG